MSTYTIKDLERISNLKAHTIRIWEQRYNLLEPERTDTNIRFYNDDQLKKLLNVCMMINKGMKISHVSKLSKKELADEIDQLIRESSQGDVHVEALINQVLISISAYDVASFDELFRQSVQGLGLNHTYTRVIYPLLVRTGLLWINDTMLPAQEHFLSNLIRQKLFTAIDSLPTPENTDQTWVLFLNEEEDHEIGLLFAYYLIRQHGKKVIYLGTRVPYDDLKNVVTQTSPTHIYSFFVKTRPEQEVGTLLAKLEQDFGDSTICVSGGGTIPENLPNEKVIRITSIEDLIDIVNKKHDT